MLTKVTNSLTGRAQYVFSRDGMIISSKKIEHCRLRGVIVVIDGLLKRTVFVGYSSLTITFSFHANYRSVVGAGIILTACPVLGRN